MHPSREAADLMHISVRLVVYPKTASAQDHALYIDKLTKHLGRKWSVAKADFRYDEPEEGPEFHYIWDFHEHKEPNLTQFNILPLGIRVKLTIK